ncbi:hypothetical protein [Paenibacillus glacialis]|uniref:Uncharacterized protein n=1 Tax=Paenibacillus glacialis TaxID=494026 RepID=A0A162MDL9_9BACL|nr:hypothetical protein [Paenibacillus glacialis]OAB42643.1 hypothetical protein PGLA_11625 [Paenibacillus glacialis]
MERYPNRQFSHAAQLIVGNKLVIEVIKLKEAKTININDIKLCHRFKKQKSVNVKYDGFGNWDGDVFSVFSSNVKQN